MEPSQVVIRPAEDTPPDVDVEVEVIRKTNQGYLCTPRARIPFSGKIRDDHGYWNQLETYIAAHSDVEFTHGLCPECVPKLYPDYHRDK